MSSIALAETRGAVLAEAPPAAPCPSPARHWRVLWTRSNCEQLVHDDLVARGYLPFLPKVRVWSRRRNRRQQIDIPLFPGYVFLDHLLDKAAYIDVLKARGMVRALGERWDRLAEVAEAEVEAIRRLVEARLPASPHPFLKQGQWARIVRGPLQGLEGIFLRAKPGKGLLVLSVELLQRSVSVEVDCTLVVPATAQPRPHRA